jgi:predicted DNA-binding transcriptional regulator AlpA
VTPAVETEDLVDSQLVAEILGLAHRNTVSTYLRRYPDFPRPVVELGPGRVRLWLRQDVIRWARETGRRGDI